MNKKEKKKSQKPVEAKIKVESLTFEEYLNIEKGDVNYKKKKAILTITIDEESCQKLKRLVPEGEVSKFAAKIIKDGLRKIEQKVFCEYAKLNQDEALNEQIKKLSI